MKATLYALGTIALWSTLASLSVSLAHVPPFLLTGLALLLGSVVSLPLMRFDWRQWRVPGSTLALGVYGLFGYHFCLFMALQTAPPVQANLVNYLWPLLLVVLAPVLLPGIRLRPLHLLAAVLGFGGAAVAIVGGSGAGTATWSWGYVPAFGAAIVWSSYSLLCKRVQSFPTAVIGLFALLSGLLALLCHALLEPAVVLSAADWGHIALMGLGPLGVAFFLWDKALKLGDARQIGVLSYLTPLCSTTLLLLYRGQALTWNVLLAAVLIISAALLGARAARQGVAVSVAP